MVVTTVPNVAAAGPRSIPAIQGRSQQVRALLVRLAPTVLAAAVFAVALLILRHDLRHFRYHEIIAAAHAEPFTRVLAALALTVLSYIVLTGYEWLGLQYAGHPLRWHRVSFASFTGYALSQGLGFPLLTGGSLRARLYSAWGLSTLEIAAAIAFNSLTFALGLCSVAGVAFLLEPIRIPSLMHMHALAAQPIGIAVLMLPLSYVVLCMRVRAPVRLFRWRVRPPSARLAMAQLAIGSVDWLIAAAVLYVLIPTPEPLSYFAFVAVFLMCQAIGLLSHVPGGVGVFESLMVLSLKTMVAPLPLLGALLIYRMIYYVLPLVGATGLLVAREAHLRRTVLARAGQLAGRSVSMVVPQALAILTLLSGGILLVSGATPAIPERLRFLHSFLPLGVLDLSHFLGSIAGTGLIILAWAIARRLDAAYHLAIWLLTAGMAFSLLKGLDYEEAAALSLVLTALFVSRHEFDRRASLLSEPLSPEWLVAAAGVLFGATWLGFFAYKHVAYSSELWWQFALHGNAPRFLRATAGAVGVSFTVGMVRLLRPAVRARPVLSRDDLTVARSIIERTHDSNANLALLGDKNLFFNEERTAFIMYAVSGRSWIAMGDPVGPDADLRSLAWSFHEQVDRYAGRTVFYEASAQHLPLYIDLGLSLMKIGEEARVQLSAFTLEGSARSGLRRVLRSVEQQGASFEVVPTAELAAVLPELRTVSDNWLQTKRAREKGFSLGFFDETYLLNFPTAVVRSAGAVVAFANLWKSAGHTEIAPDLMRYTQNAPRGIMDYLFTNLLLWGRDQGYDWFNLGMAPLTGLESRRLAPAWNKVGTWIFRHGEHFYNFQGLRQYKEKFGPVWEPRYLACPGGLALPGVLTNVTSLISGGLVGVISR